MSHFEMMMKNRIRLILIVGALLVALCALISFGVRRGQTGAAAPIRSGAAALPNLQGAAATEYLKQQGLHGALGEAVEAARYGVYEMSAGQRTANTGHYYANNPAQQWQTRFAPDGISLTSSAQSNGQSQKSWRAEMRLESIGYGGRQHSVGAGAFSAQGKRVEYTRPIAEGNLQLESRAAIKEWYVNRAEGLEQGFTLAAKLDQLESGTRCFERQ